MEEKYIKKKKRVIGILLVAIMVMAVGYASFATSLVINGTANIASNWKVVFTDITQISKTDGVEIKENPTARGTKATFNIGLTSPGDKIEYKITVANQGTIDAIIESIEASETGSDAIKFEIENIKTGDILTKNTTTTFNVIISYDENVTTQPNTLENKLTVDIKYVQSLGQDITPSEPSIESGQVVTLANKLESLIPTAQSDANIDFGASSSTQSGLYYTDISTNARSTNRIYYYRGNVDVNYVEFGTSPGSCTYGGSSVSYLELEPFSVISNPNKQQCVSTNICTAFIDNVLPYVIGVLGIKDAETCLVYKSLIEQEMGASQLTSNADKFTCQYKGAPVLFNDNEYENVEDDELTFSPTKSQCESTGVCLHVIENVNIPYIGVTDTYAAAVNMSESDCVSQGGIWTGEKATYVGPGGYNPYQGEATYTPGETLTWRITRTNEDGSVRLVANKPIATVQYNTIDTGDNASVGYMYGSLGATTYEETHANTNDGNVKEVLDYFYDSALSDYENMFSETAGFCNDRSLTPTPEYDGDGIGTNVTLYMALSRLGNKTPQFTCPQTNDLFTLKGSGIGNQALDKPIGLLSMDEVMYLGIDTTHLTNAWTMTPLLGSYPSDTEGRVSIVATTTYLKKILEGTEDDLIENLAGTNKEYSIYPVINLRTDVPVIKGNGTKDNPYVIKTN